MKKTKRTIHTKDYIGVNTPGWTLEDHKAAHAEHRLLYDRAYLMTKEELRGSIKAFKDQDSIWFSPLEKHLTLSFAHLERADWIASLPERLKDRTRLMLELKKMGS